MRTAGVNFLILFWRKLKNISNKFASRKDIFTIIWAGKWREMKHGKGKRGWDLIRGWRKIIMRKQNKKWKVRRGKKPKERTSCAATQEEHHLAFLHCRNVEMNSSITEISIYLLPLNMENMTSRASNKHCMTALQKKDVDWRATHKRNEETLRLSSLCLWEFKGPYPTVSCSNGASVARHVGNFPTWGK